MTFIEFITSFVNLTTSEDDFFQSFIINIFLFTLTLELFVIWATSKIEVDEQESELGVSILITL